MRLAGTIGVPYMIRDAGERAWKDKPGLYNGIVIRLIVQEYYFENGSHSC
jgi:hypothetical protein